jgi:predicted nucleotidyltransferase
MGLAPAQACQLRPRDLAALCAVLASLPGAREVFLFGSRATGAARRASDLDLAIAAPGLSAREWADLCERLEGAPLIYELDLVRLDTLPEGALKERIRREGILIHKA